MPRFEDLDPDSQRFLSNFPCRDDGPPPWTPLNKPLNSCKLAIVTSSGLIRRSDTPFDLGWQEGDPSFRTIPADTNPAELTFSHVSTNWDRTGFAMDINVVFPIDRLRELVREGEIGAVADEHYSFMGAIFNSDPLVADMAPEVGRRLRAAGVDVVLLVPT
jgi:D-proline reductase (dithiol) PrdB